MSGNNAIPIEPAITDSEYSALLELIENEFGYAFKGDKRLSLFTKLSHRLGILGLGSFGQYVDYASKESSGKELFEIFGHVVNHETYFFREADPLGTLVRALAGRGIESPKILSCGCSSGEEVYTLCIMISESGLFEKRNARVVGADAAPNMLRRARRGAYPDSSFRTVENHKIMTKYFDVFEDMFVVKQEIKDMAEFHLANLRCSEDVRPLGEFDAVLCRNLLMYLSRDGRLRVLENIHSALKPGGMLLLGKSESASQRPDIFERREEGETTIYIKTASGGPQLRPI